jgi:alginate O-acetyltransferase complex protein AlgI
MLFNSTAFFLYFAVVFSLYCLLDHRKQNLLLLVAGFFFYGCWDWRFTGLLLASSFFDFYLGKKISETEVAAAKRRLLTLSVVLNLSILGFFKYFNFFIENARLLLHALGLPHDFYALDIILPLGLSFYTFQSLSYTIDVYRGRVAPAQRFLDMAVYVSFFPHLVAGPIVRASDLLPQVITPRVISWRKITEGTHMIFWGLFKKVVIADNLAALVDPIFTPGASLSAPLVLIGLYCFAFQIYCDFSGYSDMARGLAKWLGFDIMQNFNVPYFSSNPSEFWRRWHISLSEWLRDYLYIALGGNRGGRGRTYSNLMITMLLGGLWHGAAWTYVLWGAFHGLLLVAHRLLREIPLVGSILAPFSRLPGGRIFKIVSFFHLICLSWLFFRCLSLEQVGDMLWALGAVSEFLAFDSYAPLLGQFLLIASPLVVCEWYLYRKNDPWAFLYAPTAVRALLYLVLFYSIVIFGAGGGKEFIYFQF